MSPKSRIWVIIRIETKSREFLSKMLITHELIERGYGVIITNKLFEDLTLFPKGIYLINSLFPDTHKKFINVIKQGNRVVLMDEEGLVYQNPQSLLNRYKQESLALIDQMFCFGEEQKKDILSRYPEIKDKVFVTGNPRMNMLNDYYSPLLNNNIGSIREMYGDFILIASNFATANPEIVQSDRVDRFDYMKTILNSMGEKVGEGIGEFYYYDLRNFEAMKKLIKNISKKFPEVNIVVRPHPSESISGWMDIADMLKNVFIVREGALLSWIKAAKLVIENNCTSAIESLYLETPCISYRPYVNSKFDQPLPNLVSLNLYSEDDVIETIKHIIVDKAHFNYDTYLNIARNYISNQEKDKSVVSIVDRISEIKMDAYPYSADICRKKKYSIRRWPFLIKIGIKKMIRVVPIPIGLINKLPGKYKASVLNAKYGIVKESKFDGINGVDVKSQLKVISNFKNSDIGFDITDVSGNIIVLPQ